MDIYRQQLLDHYNNPRNNGELLDANAIMKLENLSCGDNIMMQLKIKDKIIEEVMFDGDGCAISIASASVLSEHIKGKSISEVEKMSLEDLMDLLKVQLTVSRLKCANLSLEASKKAISEYTNS